MKVLKYIILIPIALLLVLLTILFISYEVKSDREKAKFWFESKIKFGGQGSIEKQWFYEQSIKCDSTYAKSWHQKSVAFNKRGDFATGFKLLDRAVELTPVEFMGYRGFIKLYHTHDYEGAIEDYKELDRLTPQVVDSPWGEDIYHVIGLSYLQLKQLDSANKYFETSIAKTVEGNGEDWVDVKVFLYGGITQQERGNWEASILLFDKAIQYDKRFSEAYYYRGLSMVQLGKKLEACENFNTSQHFFDKGYNQTNSYFEMPYQLYRSMIETELTKNCN